jgi:hypothetical protein
LPDLETWVYQFYLNTCIRDKTMKPFANFIQTKAVNATNCAELLVPRRLLKTLQRTMPSLKNNG